MPRSRRRATAPARRRVVTSSLKRAAMTATFRPFGNGPGSISMGAAIVARGGVFSRWGRGRALSLLFGPMPLLLDPRSLRGRPDRLGSGALPRELHRVPLGGLAHAAEERRV